MEIGPKDGEDTERLHTLNPKELIMFDLPDKTEQNEKWKDKLKDNDKLYVNNFYI